MSSKSGTVLLGMNQRRGDDDGRPEMESFAAIVADCRACGCPAVTLLVDRPLAQRQHRRHHRPQRPARTRRSTPAGRPGTCTVEPPDPAPTCSRRHPGAVLRTGRRPPARRLHPVHRQARSEPGPLETPIGRTEDRPRRSAGRPQRQPRGDAALRRSPSSKPARAGCPAGSQVGESTVTASICSGSPTPPTPPATKCPSTTSSRRRASRPASASNWPATKSSSRPTSPGTATTTRASRSPCPRYAASNRWHRRR